MRSTIRRCAVALGLFGLLQTPVQAVENASLLASINAQRLQTYQLQTLFHLLSLEEGAASVAAQLQAAVQQFAQQVEQLDELSAGQGLDTEAAALQLEARRFQQLALSNEVLSQGFVDLHTQSELSASGAALSQGYGNLLSKLQTQGQSSDALQEQAILMQQITAGYVRETSSLDGGGAIYDNARDLELPVDKLALQFRQQLSALDQQYAGQTAVKQRLQKVASNWKYIEKSLLNYKEKAVPLVVVRCSDKIIANLTAPAAIEPRD